MLSKKAKVKMEESMKNSDCGFKVHAIFFLVSRVISNPACHAGDRGLISRRGATGFYSLTF